MTIIAAEYDDIIVGAGSAGAVLASRLSEAWRAGIAEKMADALAHTT